MSAAVKEAEERKKNAKSKVDKEGRDRWCVCNSIFNK